MGPTKKERNCASACSCCLPSFDLATRQKSRTTDFREFTVDELNREGANLIRSDAQKETRSEAPMRVMAECGTGTVSEANKENSWFDFDTDDGPLVAQIKLASMTRSMKGGRTKPDTGEPRDVRRPSRPPSSGPGDVLHPDRPPSSGPPGSFNSRAWPTASGWSGPEVVPVVPLPPHTITGNVVPFGALFDDVHLIICTTHLVLESVLQQEERVRRQWWCEVLPTAKYRMGGYSSSRLPALMSMFDSARRRMRGISPYSNFIVEIDSTTTCTKYGFTCDVHNLSHRIKFCRDFLSKSYSDQVDALIAALITEWPFYSSNKNQVPLSIADAYEVALWARVRFEQNGDHTADYPRSDGHWDVRPMKTFEPQFSLVHSYSTHPKALIGHTQLRRAWDVSWTWIETAFRFLFRLSVLACENCEEVEWMWNYGWYLGVGRPQNCTTTCDQDLDCMGAGLILAEGDVDVSLRAYFGDYTPQRLLSVARVVLELLLRYQGTSEEKPVTHFKIRPGWARNSDYYGWAEAAYSGNIVLAFTFFEDQNELTRRKGIYHEMMHWLVAQIWEGRPEDIRECGWHGNSVCYGEEGAKELVAENQSLAVLNIDNYREWIFKRYQMWGGAAWPPPGEGDWVNDPIGDADFVNIGILQSQDALEWYRLFSDRLLKHVFCPWNDTRC